MSTPVYDWLAQRAGTLPEHPAVVAGDATLSYRELGARVQALGSRLVGAGIGRGERVGLLSTNSVAFVEAVHALPRVGAVVVPLNVRLTPGELAWQVGDAGIRSILSLEQTRELAEAVSVRTGATVSLLDAGPGADAPPGRVPGEEALVFEHDPDDPLAVIYTSGTTGRPKGAVLSYGNFLASAVASAFNIGMDRADRWLVCMPLFHVGGLSIVTRSVIYGTTLVLHEGFDERAVNAELHERGATLLSVVPTMLERMLRVAERPFPSTVRAVLVGGGPCSNELLNRALAHGLPVLQTYGLTEATSQVTTLAPADALARVGSAGKPLFGTRVRIDAPAGEPGEILVSGPTVASGYLAQPGATAITFRDGWLRTGDIGRLDEDGFLWVLDRRDDLVVTGGENVYPAEVEAALRAHHAVRAAAVVGLADERWGQVVAAAVVLEAECGVDELEAHCRDRLAGYKVPRRFVFMNDLPATASGKVQRSRVREALAETA